MQWETLTQPQFEHAVRDTGLCLLACGVLERHADHLPLGTDYLNAHQLACDAAEREAAVVFPPFYFGQIYEARCFPGTVTLPPALLLSIFQATLDEIARNGFHKIMIVNGHGGNNHFLRFLAQSTLSEPKPYTLYLFENHASEAEDALWQSTLETPLHGHACECETSVTLANFPEMVHMEEVPAPETGQPRGRLAHVQGAYSGIWWYADYPTHYAGDATPASAEKGRVLHEIEVARLAKLIAAVKADTVTPALEREFFAH